MPAWLQSYGGLEAYWGFPLDCCCMTLSKSHFSSFDIPFKAWWYRIYLYREYFELCHSSTWQLLSNLSRKRWRRKNIRQLSSSLPSSVVEISGNWRPCWTVAHPVQCPDPTWSRMKSLEDLNRLEDPVIQWVRKGKRLNLTLLSSDIEISRS